MDKLQLVGSMKMRKLDNHSSGGWLKKRKHNSGGLSPLFSEDLMTEIFLWLPLKSLVRFKRLSKRWYFLISDKHNSYFRRNYLSTFSSSRRRRRNRRIVGSDDNSSAIMAGFFYRKPIGFGISYDLVRFLPNTCTQFRKYSFLAEAKKRGESSTTTTTTTTPTTEIIINNKINPFLSLVKSLDDEFLSARILEDEESYPPDYDRRLSVDEALDKMFSACLHEDEELYLPDDRKNFLSASSNGFLLFTLQSGITHSTDFLVNPVTMEWLALPQLKANDNGVYVGFVCKGDYPSLDFVEYTIVRLSWLKEGVSLLFQLFSNSTGGTDHNNEWSEYRVSCESLGKKFDLCGQHNSVIVSTTTTTTTNNQGGTGGGGSRILLYFLVIVRITRAIAIVPINLNEGGESLQMFETPGPDRGISVSYCDDYIREFDDGVIHYVRFCSSTDRCSTDFEFWVLNTESGEWYLKHRASLKTMTMTEGYPWTDVVRWEKACMLPQSPYEVIALYHIHAFHPMNPNLIFLTLYGRFVCYNVETGILELVYDFVAQNMKDDYCHYVYQWPCWPPLL